MILKNKIKALAIGGFDGIHLGHKALLDKLGDDGAILVIDGNRADITPDKERERYVKYPIQYLKLDAIMQMSAEEFMTLVKAMFPNLVKIVVGYDFRFGKERSACGDDIHKWFNKDIVIIDEVKKDNISIHSRTIRGYIRVGDIAHANRLLGREYSIYGDVIKGQGVGMKKLYPTINLSIKKFLIPASGVYASYTEIDTKKYNSVSFIGHRVSTDGEFAVETHIIDSVVENCKNARIFFIEKLRDNMMFDKLEELKQQISRDIKRAKKLLNDKL